MVKIYSWLSYLVISLWSRTVRACRLGEYDTSEKLSADGGVIYGFLHGEQFILYRLHEKRGVTIMTSMSRDGELQTGILMKFGYKIVRGSSSRGGAEALINMIEIMRRDKSSVAFAVDGPRGPVEKVKPGIIYLAMKTGRPIVPLRVFYTSFFTLKKTWDQYKVPLPFSKANVIYGKPFYIKKDQYSDDEIQKLCAELENKFHELGGNLNNERGEKI